MRSRRRGVAAPAIRVKALGLHWRDRRLLASDLLDDAGQVKGVRPLGGCAELGEPARDAVLRDFREELGIDVTVVGGPAVMEDIDTHKGAAGHEVPCVFEDEFPAGAFPGQGRIRFEEDRGESCVARSHDPAELDIERGPARHSQGLRAFLARAAR